MLWETSKRDLECDFDRAEGVLPSITCSTLGKLAVLKSIEKGSKNSPWISHMSHQTSWNMPFSMVYEETSKTRWFVVDQ